MPSKKINKKVMVEKDIVEKSLEIPKVIEASKIPETSDADLIWEKIKDVKINPFSVKEEPLSKFFNKVNISPDKCFLTTKVSAAIPMLEGVVISSKLNFEVQEKFIIISRK